MAQRHQLAKDRIEGMRLVEMLGAVEDLELIERALLQRRVAREIGRPAERRRRAVLRAAPRGFLALAERQHGRIGLRRHN